ncbi:MAG TPA: hypothetical protein VGB52_14025 [Actinomycetota bacterium]
MVRRAKRLIVVLGAIGAMVFVPATVALADYHPACAGIVTGADEIDLQVGEGSINYSGTVECPGSQSRSVEVELSGAASGSATAACGDVVTCVSPTAASGSVPLVEGSYQVTMSFHVEGVGGVLVYDPEARCGLWLVTEGSATGPLPCDPPESGGYGALLLSVGFGLTASERVVRRLRLG